MVGPDEFRFWHPVDVRFQDVDLYGHAHHSKVLIYFEEARWAYWNDVMDASQAPNVMYVLSEVRVRYHERITYPLKLDAGVRVSLLGKKHFVMEYELRSTERVLLASGSSVQVMFDYDKNDSVTIPATIRRAIENWDLPRQQDGSGVTPPGDY